jgi:8-oxo-dGTP pyrophosphatase MutT (NUDIX family)
MKKKKEDEINDKKQFFKPQSCRNCGINGHLYKDCPHPIMSFGLICYKNINDEIMYLMIQRKDSLSFMEFIRGKYDTQDFIYIKKLINGMTLNERNMLLKKPFEDIWNYVWCQTSLSIKHTKEFIESKQKFDNLIINNILQNIIKNLEIIKNETEQEWGFPKGRRKLREDDIDCAIREFCEETRLKPDDIKIYKEILPFEEIFFGTNNVLYKHSYYITKFIKENEDDLYVDPKCLEQVREVRALKWFKYDEVLQHIKKYNIERIEIFKQANNKILEMETLLE